MNDRNYCEITQPEGVYHRFELLQEIDDTLTEMEIYMKRNPEDEMARLQYEQYFKKREALVEPFLLYCEAVSTQETVCCKL
ncbi:hypothetical protein [Paenibacillus spongiae]|uniref:YlbF family regulator n=1 Tax=Paenibacillus spongiae TaxID=2909671 RepID=A0ABY5S0T9_9BACL|nr:hypothetical protein [Paenibacillus spongiae]UVI27466.1 hypothetical protein L1F29_18520 [Paenibacillus spongiae]